MQPGPDLQTVAIYAPVVGQLAKVEERLRGVCQTDIADLNPLLDYALSSGGKRVRPALTLLAAEFREHERERSLIMASAVELLHLATLIHDDTVDNAGMRRGKPTINKLYGKPRGGTVGGLPVRHIGHLRLRYWRGAGHSPVLRNHHGAGQRPTHRVSSPPSDPTKARKLYNERIYRKTASLFCTSAESGAILSDAPEHEVKALRQYGYNIGMAFQIVDDLLDVQGDASEIGKPVGNDLLQGVLTLPAIMLMERYPNDHPIDSLFAAIKSGQGDVTELLDRSVGMITDSNIIPDCFTVIREYCSSASEALAVLPDCPPRRSLSDMVDFIRERSR